MNMDLL